MCYKYTYRSRDVWLKNNSAAINFKIFLHVNLLDLVYFCCKPKCFFFVIKTEHSKFVWTWPPIIHTNQTSEQTTATIGHVYVILIYYELHKKGYVTLSR